MDYFLGIDGGQSHTTALVADADGNVLGVGHAGESNHTRKPGGRERLTQAIRQAAGAALTQAGLLAHDLAQFPFASAYLSLTGEPHEKREIVQSLLRAAPLTVEHDTRGALAGAFACGEGVIVLAGTGSVACGEMPDAHGAYRHVRVGGRGFVFADEGSAFAIARRAVSRALRRADRAEPADALHEALRAHFHCAHVAALCEDFYAGDLSHERLASFARQVDALAEQGEAAAQALLDQAADELVELAAVVVARLAPPQPLPLAHGGQVFRSRRLTARFAAEITRRLGVSLTTPRFDPAIGALLLAYRQANIVLTPAWLNRLAAAHPAC